MEERDEQLNLAYEAYGHRIVGNQALPEYLLEFALVFLADKPSPDLGGVGRFPTRVVKDNELEYVTQGRIGLKRLIFFERSKHEHRLALDRQAYYEMRRLIESKIIDVGPDWSRTDVVDIIQELFYGYNAVLLNRSWFVQSLLPVSRELIFPEAMRRGVKAQAGIRLDTDALEIRRNDDVDNDFQFNGYYFLARGGEVYYLHVLQGILQSPELRSPIEQGLMELFNSRPELSKLARWIQSTWEEYMGVTNKSIHKTCRWIPEEYGERASYTCRELACFLGARMDPLQKIQLLSIGVVLQILRMMHDRAGKLVKRTRTRPAWIVNIPDCASVDVRGLATRSYQECEDDLLGALYAVAPQGLAPDELQELIAKAAPNAHLLFRKLGKAAELVVPPIGANMRFSLSEDLVKFLVLSLIQPGDRVLLSDFLRTLYEHFGIVIGPQELQRYWDQNGNGAQLAGDATLLQANEDAFKDMLKACGFLRDLSDATAIVENPFGG